MILLTELPDCIDIDTTKLNQWRYSFLSLRIGGLLYSDNGSVWKKTSIDTLKLEKGDIKENDNLLFASHIFAAGFNITSSDLVLIHK